MFVHFNRKSMLLFYNLTIKPLSFPITQPMQIDFLQMYFLCMANICPAKHNVFFCSSPLQRWVFSLWLSSLATEHQSASRFVVRGDYSVGRDQHIAKPGEIPYLLDLMVRISTHSHVFIFWGFFFWGGGGYIVLKAGLNFILRVSSTRVHRLFYLQPTKQNHPKDVYSTSAKILSRHPVESQNEAQWMLYVVAKALYRKMSLSKGILSSQWAWEHGILGEINKVKGSKQHVTH